MQSVGIVKKLIYFGLVIWNQTKSITFIKKILHTEDQLINTIQTN
jgi:hypothetical protein